MRLQASGLWLELLTATLVACGQAPPPPPTGPYLGQLEGIHNGSMNLHRVAPSTLEALRGR